MRSSGVMKKVSQTCSTEGARSLASNTCISYKKHSGSPRNRQTPCNCWAFEIRGALAKHSSVSLLQTCIPGLHLNFRKPMANFGNEYLSMCEVLGMAISICFLSKANNAAAREVAAPRRSRAPKLLIEFSVSGCVSPSVARDPCRASRHSGPASDNLP